MPSARRERVRVVTHAVYPEKLQQKIDELNRVLFERRRDLKILGEVKDLQVVKANLLRDCELARLDVLQHKRAREAQEEKIREREVAVAQREHNERMARPAPQEHCEHVLADLATHRAELDRRAVVVRKYEEGHDRTKDALREETSAIEEARGDLGREAKKISHDLEEASRLQVENATQAGRLAKEREYVNGQSVLLQNKMEVMDRGFRELEKRQGAAGREDGRLKDCSRELDGRDLELQGRENDLFDRQRGLDGQAQTLVRKQAKLAARAKELGEWEKNQQKRETNLVKRQGKVESEERRLAEVRRNLTRQAGRDAT